MHVIERVGLSGCAGGLHEGFFVAGDMLQHAECQQRSAHHHQLAPFVLCAQREGETKRGERRIGGELEQSLSQQTQRDLRIGALEHGAGEAQQHVAASIVAGQASGGVDQVGRPLVETCAVAFDVEDPAGLSRKPLAQPIGMAAHGGKVFVRRVHQWHHQQGTQGSAHLLALEALLALAQVVVGGAPIRAHRPFCTRVTVIT
jgi:hypothetical protein